MTIPKAREAAEADCGSAPMDLIAHAAAAGYCPIHREWSHLERAQNEAYQTGAVDWYHRGWDKGHRNGYERAMREVLEWLDSQKLGNGETKVAVTTREIKAFIQEKLK